MKAILLTGANGGIGQALYRKLIQDGFQVIPTDHGENTQEYADFLPFDLSQLHLPEQTTIFRSQLQSLLRERSLYALVNNAAIQLLGRIETLKIDDFMASLQINVTAPLLLSQLCYPLLKQSQGTIVNIGSIHSRLTKPGFISYATSKAALEGLTRALAVDCGEFVRVNAISPAAINTNMLREGFSSQPKKFDQLKFCHPANRIGEADEIAVAVSCLLTGEMPFANGAIWNLDGGISGRLHDPE